ncbi:MAG: hypothetical protein P4L84_30645 [Isosphaeraceae bacterium]|nr:hypothetical protein [Isosphaeraceae bacterium]
MTSTFSLALLAALGCLLAVNLFFAVRTWIGLRALLGSDAVRSSDELRQEVHALKTAVEKLKPDPRAGRHASPQKTRSHRIDRPEENAVPGPTLIAVPNLATSPDTNSPDTAELGRRFGPIWSLAETGASAETIAERTGQPIGQVELILGLRRQVGASHSLHSRPGNRN